MKQYEIIVIVTSVINSLHCLIYVLKTIFLRGAGKGGVGVDKIFQEPVEY